MLAVVLVGGFGTRLRPLTLTTPKQMIPVGDHPMIEHVIARLAAYGVDRAVLSLGYRPDAFRSAYPGDRCAGVDLTYAVDPEPLDTAGAIRYAAIAADVDGTFVAVNGDVITALDLSEQVAFHRRVGAGATLHLTPVDDPSRFGVVPTDCRGRVEGFLEKPTAAEAPTNMINAGTYVMEPEVLEVIPDGRPVSIERETFPRLVEQGVLYGYADDAYWVDAGTPESYLQVTLDLAAGRWGHGLEAVQGEIEPSAIVDESVIGPRASVGASARIQRSVVLAGAKIGSHAVVEDSIIGAGAIVGADASITAGSVVGDDAAVDPGARLTGARVPEDEV